MPRPKNGWPNGVASRVDPVLAGLPETQRLVMFLFAVEDFTCRDIADILNSRSDTVAVCLNTARRQLEYQHRQQFS